MTQKSVLIDKNNGDSTAIKIDEVSASLVGSIICFTACRCQPILLSLFVAHCSAFGGLKCMLPAEKKNRQKKGQIVLRDKQSIKLETPL